MVKKYTHEMKKKLANKIQKIKKKEDMKKIVDIIMEDKPSYMENNNGVFMFFHKLNDNTYVKIEKELKRLNKAKNYYTESVNSEKASDKKEFTPYADDEFPSQRGISPKLKFSNREKSLIKRRRYDKNISLDVDSDVVYTNFSVEDISESNISNESDKIGGKSKNKKNKKIKKKAMAK